MKKLVTLALLATSSAFADVVLPGKVETTVVRPVTAVTTNTVSYENVKVVYTSFTANWAGSNTWYTLTYHLQDTKTKRMVPGTMVTDRLTPKDIKDKLGVDVSTVGAGIGQMIDAYLDSKFKKVAPVQ